MNRKPSVAGKTQERGEERAKRNAEPGLETLGDTWRVGRAIGLTPGR